MFLVSNIVPSRVTTNYLVAEMINFILKLERFLGFAVGIWGGLYIPSIFIIIARNIVSICVSNIVV